jgi:hypothetical protein
LRSLRATLYLLAAGDGIAVTARQNLEDHLAVLFAGEFDGRVDSHLRIVIPAVFAGELSEGVGVSVPADTGDAFARPGLTLVMSVASAEVEASAVLTKSSSWALIWADFNSRFVSVAVRRAW